jgi:hypothetical protein
VAAVARGRRATSVYWAIRLFFLDAGGDALWDTVVGPTLRSGERLSVRHAGELRAWLADLHERLALELAAATAWTHDRECARLAADVGPTIARVMDRERAILRVLRDRDARLAQPLVQAALFDRRALRHAEAQRRLSALAIERASARLDRLQRLVAVRQGDRCLIFALVCTR